MTEAFLRAVVDTLLPADDGLPSGTEAGVTLALADHGRLLTTIAMRSGGEASFVAADEPTRVATLQAVAQADGPAFERMIVPLLADYCEAETVLRAFGWRSDPPQPRGFELPPFDETVLAKAKQRGRIWR
ncbi:MAG TPA: hypothetical protein VKU61_09955 [Candidatus Binatia bacterium]|nr:hypothetical protein [Candidatus Binatia bacterium]